MKKSLLIIAAVYFASLSFSQELSLPMDEETGKVTYTEVVEEDGKADVLYENALAWFNEFYPNARNVIKRKDAEGNIITGRGKFRMMVKNDKGVPEKAGFILYDIEIMTRDGRYKYIITNVELDYITPFGVEEWMKPEDDKQVHAMNQKKLKAIEKYFEELIDSLEDGMEPEEKAEKEEW